MNINGSLYSNGDDCYLAWMMEPAPDCWGFAVSRDLKTKDGKEFHGYILNRTGFDGDQNPPHSAKPSSQWPFQRYTWTDHGVGEGDTVSYTIAPVFSRNGALAVDQSSRTTLGPVTVTAKGAGPVWAYFNRGVLLSQFISKQLGDKIDKSDLLALKKELEKEGDKLRQFLSGDIGSHLAELLDQARDEGWHVYAALYELSDDRLIEKLAALGKKAHLVLANGSTKKKGEDGNQEANDKLKGVIDLTRRMLWSKGLGHNKFVVFADSPTEPKMVWTGSTNWASTGLCTQANNAILIRDAKFAAKYLEQYKLLKADKAQFGEDLTSSNDEAKTGSGAIGKWSVRFTRTTDGGDMDDLAGIVNAAQDAILFLMFEPGNSGLLQAIQARTSPASPFYNPDLYLHGVVNSLQSGFKKGHAAGTVNLVSRGEARSFELDVVQPEGVGTSLPGWAAEVTRRDFMIGQGGVIGHAVIHSKTLVIDPFTHPVIVTGSHNFSKSASLKNDENFVVIRGNAELAQRYAVNIMGLYQHYRWRAYLVDCVRKGVSPWQGLQKGDKWQAKLNDARRRETSFWIRAAGAAAAAGRR